MGAESSHGATMSRARSQRASKVAQQGWAGAEAAFNGPGFREQCQVFMSIVMFLQFNGFHY